MSRERRREPRYPCRLPITLKVGGVVQETITQDVSHRGLFAVTDDPPALRQLVTVNARLPNQDPVTTHAMSVFALERGNKLGRTPGAGLQFYAISAEFKKAWEAFIDALRREQSPPVPDSKPREHVRYRLRLAVRPKSIDELVTIYTRDVSRGGMFLLTPELLEIDQKLSIDVFHPDSDEVFTLGCVVKRVAEGPPPGVGVALDLDERGRTAFGEFVHSVLPELDADAIELIDPGDPQLE